MQKEETDPREGKVARVRHTPSAAARCVTKSTLAFENEAASRAVFAYPVRLMRSTAEDFWDMVPENRLFSICTEKLGKLFVA